MSETPFIDLPSMVRPDQKELLTLIAKHMGVSVSAVVRWALDDARPFLLSRACLQEENLPKAARQTT